MRWKFPAKVLSLLLRKHSGLVYVSGKLLDSLKSSAISFLYAPRNVMGISEGQQTKILERIYDSKVYYVAVIQKGFIFTNRINNISILSGRSLVPLVSWQWDDHDLTILPDCQNFLLTRQIRLTQPPKFIGTVIVSLLTGTPGNNNYYHWFFDCLSRLCLTNSVIASYQHVKYLVPDDIYSYQKETLKELGITSLQYITSREVSFVSAKTVIATSYPNPQINDPAEWTIDFIRKSFIHLGSPPRTQHEFLYISRRDSLRARRLTNEEYLLSLLNPLGFRTIYLSEISFPEQVNLFANAKMIVGVHGAGFANLVFSRKGAVVCELFSQCYQPVMYQKISRYLQLDYKAINCLSDEPASSAPPCEAWSYSTNLRLSVPDALAISERARVLINDAS
jgi:capsular polysaccharide biosynthesis protein